VTIQIFNSKKPMRWKFMEDNMMTEFAKGFCMGIMRRLNDYRQLHHRQLIYLGEVPQCKVCKGQQCYYYAEYCSKVAGDIRLKTKQMYWGKKKLLISSKPTILLDKL
jgi:hypothetical protein